MQIRNIYRHTIIGIEGMIAISKLMATESNASLDACGDYKVFMINNDVFSK
jgi:hypothetical protein